MKRLIRRIAAPVVLVAGIGAAATAMQNLGEPVVTGVDAQASSEVATAAQLAGAEALTQAFRAASREALQGVVHVRVTSQPRQTSQSSPYWNPFEGTPFEDLFRGFQSPTPMPRQGSGSGFIITPDGYVMTNNHVVEGATDIVVTLTDRREFRATVVGRDPSTDVAVLKIDGQNLPTVRLGDSDAIEVGDWVLALGYPLSLGETVTAGIVSAKGRNINIMARAAEDGGAAPVEHFIQTDAAINPGNSGGPLVNLRGEAIGMNTAIASPTGAYAGYGFAVPIKLAKRIADDLIEDGRVSRPRLGVNISNATPADVEAFRLPDANGAVVRTVVEGPARDAGIEIGDVIVGIDGEFVRDRDDLIEKIALRRPGDRVQLDIIRRGNRMRIPVRLDAFETTAPTREPSTASRETDAVGQLGFAAAQLTPRIAAELGLRDATDGVVITRVDPSGPAASYLQPGMRIESINDRRVRSIEDLQAIARDLKADQLVTMIVLTQQGDRMIVNYYLRR